MNIKNVLEKFDELSEKGMVNCFIKMKPIFVDYKEKESLTIAFPVFTEYLNPNKSMQGGYITAAFDNVFGTLCYYSTNEAPMATVDISTNFHYPIYEGDILTVKVFFNSLGNKMVSLQGKAYNNDNRLIATSSTNIILLNKI